MTLTEFLLARIAEDEALARDATRGPWELVDRGHSIKIVGDEPPYNSLAKWDQNDLPRGLHWLSDAPDLVHIVRHDPARVLAECDAKRRIVEHLAETAAKCPPDDWPDEGGMELAPLADQSRYLLRLLALPYADHPDYQPEWRV